MMKVRYFRDKQGPHLLFDFDSPHIKDTATKIASIQEVFEADDQCGMCSSDRICIRRRVHDDNEFFEFHCRDCGGYLELGQKRDKENLYPKREGLRENRGWKPQYVKAGEVPDEEWASSGRR